MEKETKFEKYGFRVLIAFFLCFVMLILTFAVIIPLIDEAKLYAFEKRISKIDMPLGVEKIAIKSVVGDSGGNGDYTTLRVVMLVKTHLEEEETKKRIADIYHLIFDKSDVPAFLNFSVEKCKSDTYESPRAVIVVFDELKEVQNFEGYYFIEFIE